MPFFLSYILLFTLIVYYNSPDNLLNYSSFFSYWLISFKLYNVYFIIYIFYISFFNISNYIFNSLFYLNAYTYFTSYSTSFCTFYITLSHISLNYFDIYLCFYAIFLFISFNKSYDIIFKKLSFVI